MLFRQTKLVEIKNITRKPLIERWLFLYKMKKKSIIYLMKKLIKTTLKIILLIGVIFVLFVLLKKPSLNRDWTDDAQVLPDVTINEKNISVKNIRDWRYKKDETVSWNYYDEIFDLDKVEKAYFLFNPFGKWEGVGHGFFMFEFSDGKTVSISVEARRENGEPFGALRGAFNNFELWYTWGSSADLFSRRAVFHNEDLYMYPLLIEEETVKNLFIDMAKQTEKLETEAKFYNTFTSNCTSILADSSNRVNPGSIPWTFARIFTGYADNKLYDLKLIPHDKSFEKVFEEARIDQKIKEILDSNENISKEEFWEKLNDINSELNIDVDGVVNLDTPKEELEKIEKDWTDQTLKLLTKKEWFWVKTETNSGELIKPKKENVFSLIFNNNGQISVKTDCNNVGGIYEVNKNNLKIKEMYMTEMFCFDSQESDYIKYLDKLNRVLIDKDGSLVIYFDDGQMIFK